MVGTTLTILAFILALGLDFHDSVQAMRPEGNPGVAVREEVAERFGLGFEQMMLLVEGDSMAEVLDLASEAAAEADLLVAAGVLTGYDTVTSLIPPVERQQQNLGWLAEGRQDRFDGDRIRGIFAAQVAAEGMRVDPFEPGLELFQTAIGRDQLLSIDDFQDTPETARLLDRYLATDGERWKAVVYLFPPPMIWQPLAVLPFGDLFPEITKTTNGFEQNNVHGGLLLVLVRIRQQRQKSCTFDFLSQQALVLGAGTGNSAGYDLAGLRNELAQQIQIFIVDFATVFRQLSELAACESSAHSASSGS